MIGKTWTTHDLVAVQIDGTRGLTFVLGPKIPGDFPKLNTQPKLSKRLDAEGLRVAWTLGVLAQDKDATFSEDRRTLTLSWDTFYALHGEDEDEESPLTRATLEALGVNVGAQSLQIRAEGELGRPGFKLRPVIENAAFREGPVVQTLDGGRVVLPQAQARWVQGAEALNEASDGRQVDLQAQLLAWGRLRQRVPEGVMLEPYLENEADMQPLESVMVDVDRLANGRVAVKPRVELDGVTSERFVERFEQSQPGAQKYDFDDGTGRRTRVIPTPQAQETLKALKDKPIYEAHEVPALLDPETSPIPHLETMGFSDRVLGLGVHVHRAIPRLESNTSREWFELDPGLAFKPATPVQDPGATPPAPWVADTAEKLETLKTSVERAREAGLRHVEVSPDHFVPIGDLERELPRLQAALAKAPEGTGRLQYVLEVYQNIENVEYSEATAKQVEKALRGPSAPMPPPGAKGLLLKDYQQEGYAWLWGLCHPDTNPLRGALLADEMGLGKTVTVLSVMSALHQEGRLFPSLLVVPKTLIPNWLSEADKFFPELRRSMVDLDILADKRSEVLAEQGIVVTNYEKVNRFVQEVGQVPWQMVVADEAQKIKTTSTKISNNMKGLKAQARVALTGTPIENHVGELWNIMDWVQPGLLGARTDFVKSVTADDQEQEVEARVTQQMNGCYLRRLKSRVETLKPLTQKPHEVVMTDAQKRLYEMAITDFRAQPQERGAFKVLSRLAKICAHPALVTGDVPSVEPGVSPKLDKLIEILERDVAPKGEKALIFAVEYEAQAMLQRAINQKFKQVPAIVNGRTQNERKVQLIEDFQQRPGFGVLILGLKSCGYGLTITAANHVIHFQRWWNPAVEDQANCRAHRIGQDKEVTVHTLVATMGEGASKTFDEHQDDVLREKAQLSDNILLPKGMSTQGAIATRMR